MDKKPNLDNKEVIIFDLDGTLIDSVNMFNEIYSELLRRTTGKTVSVEQIQDDWDEFAHMHKGESDMFDGFLLFLDGKYNDRKGNLEILRGAYKGIEADYILNKIKYKDYAKEVVELLREKHYKLVLATISPRSVLDIYNDHNQNLVSKFKIYDYFDLVLSYDDVKNRKPDPEVYLTVVEKMNVSKDKCLIVEDSLEGVKAANNAGIEVLNIVDENMFNAQARIDELSDYKMNSLKEFYEFLKDELSG